MTSDELSTHDAIITRVGKEFIVSLLATSTILEQTFISEKEATLFDLAMKMAGRTIH